jgi:type IX secretion system PorP/SprF family membrane protein
VQRRILVILSILLLATSRAGAQYDVSFSHYWDLEPYFNPGAVGKQQKLNIAAAYAMSFAGFENNPRSMYVGADMPLYFLKNYHGVGLSLLNDQIGLFTHQRLAVQYAYKHRLFGGMISAGVQLGLLSEGFDGSKVDVEDSGDPALATSDVNGSAFDVGFGLYYSRGPWYVGVSAQHITSPLVALGETSELQIAPTFYLTGRYNIKLRNPFLTIHPSVLVRTDGVEWRGDVSGRLVYTNDKKVMYGGVSYSPTNSVTVLVGGSFHGVHIGYSYEVYTSGISIGNGSHELIIGYQMDVNLFKKGRNKHKSVRIL